MSVLVGQTGPAWEYGPLTREDIVRFAGAAYDFVDLHYDDQAAARAGQPTVFAHGTLVAGMLGSFLTRWFGPDCTRRLNVRFVELVYPGDVLRAEGQVTSVHDGQADLRLQMVAIPDRVAVRGTATVALPG